MAQETWIAKYLRYTNNTESVDLYKEWSAVSAIAAALQRKVSLDFGHLIIYPNMYIVLIGPPGRARKGTAISPMKSLIDELGIELVAESITREQLIRRMVKAGTGDRGSVWHEEENRMITHSSLTVIAPELTVFLGYNNPKFLSDLTDWFDAANRWRYETKNKGQDEIIGVWLNLIGATTPSLLQSSLSQDAIGGGLTSRMIFVYTESRGKTVPIPFLTDEEKQLRHELLHDLEEYYLWAGNYKYTDGFIKRYIDWRMHADTHPPFTDHRLSGYVERRPIHMLKLCLIMNASRHGKMILDEEDIVAADELLRRTEGKMPLAFSGVGARSDAEVVQRMMLTIGQRKHINQGELRKEFLFDTDEDTFNNMIRSLVSVGYCKQTMQGTEWFLTYTEKKGKQ